MSEWQGRRVVSLATAWTVAGEALALLIGLLVLPGTPESAATQA